MSYPAFLPVELEETKETFLLCPAQTGSAGANAVWEDKNHRR